MPDDDMPSLDVHIWRLLPGSAQEYFGRVRPTPDKPDVLAGLDLYFDGEGPNQRCRNPALAGQALGNAVFQTGGGAIWMLEWACEWTYTLTMREQKLSKEGGDRVPERS